MADDDKRLYLGSAVPVVPVGQEPDRFVMFRAAAKDLTGGALRLMPPDQEVVAILVKPELLRVLGELLPLGFIQRPGRLTHGDRDGVVLLTESDLARIANASPAAASVDESGSAFSKRVDLRIDGSGRVEIDGHGGGERPTLSQVLARCGFQAGDRVTVTLRHELDALTHTKLAMPNRVVLANIVDLAEDGDPNPEGDLVLCPGMHASHGAGGSCRRDLADELLRMFGRGTQVAIVPVGGQYAVGGL